MLVKRAKASLDRGLRYGLACKFIGQKFKKFNFSLLWCFFFNIFFSPTKITSHKLWTEVSGSNAVTDFHICSLPPKTIFQIWSYLHSMDITAISSLSPCFFLCDLELVIKHCHAAEGHDVANFVKDTLPRLLISDERLEMLPNDEMFLETRRVIGGVSLERKDGHTMTALESDHCNLYVLFPNHPLGKVWIILRTNQLEMVINHG